MHTLIIPLKPDMVWGCPVAWVHPGSLLLLFFTVQCNTVGASSHWGLWVLGAVVSDPRPAGRCLPCWVPGHWVPSRNGNQVLEIRQRLAAVRAGFFFSFVAFSLSCLPMFFCEDSRVLICLCWDQLYTVLCRWSVSNLDFSFLVFYTCEHCLTHCLMRAIYNRLDVNEACVKKKQLLLLVLSETS